MEGTPYVRQILALNFGCDRAKHREFAMSKTSGTLAASAAVVVAALGLGSFASLLAPATADAAALPRLQATDTSGVALAGQRYWGGYGGPRHYYRPYYYAVPAPRIYTYAAPAHRYYGGHCGWLRHQAKVTGSRYWWHRYRDEC